MPHSRTHSGGREAIETPSRDFRTIQPIHKISILIKGRFTMARRQRGDRGGQREAERRLHDPRRPRGRQRPVEAIIQSRVQIGSGYR